MRLKRIFLLTALTLIISQHDVFSQRTVALRDSVIQYIFSFDEIEFVEDSADTLTIGDVSDPKFAPQFTPSVTFSPENYDRTNSYWYRIRVEHDSASKHQWQIEFFDQTIDYLDFFTPAAGSSFLKHSFGDSQPFHLRLVRHKNFFVKLPEDYHGIYTYYFKVKSHQQANVLVVLRTADYFVNYALDEYFFFGIFYGMILVFCFYNLLMFAAVRERHYIYYILYLLSIGLYEMSADGIAFQYLWPDAITWNQYAVGFMLYFASTFALFFAAAILNLRKRYPGLLALLTGAFIFRTLFFVLSLTVAEEWFRFRFIEVVPFGTAFYAAIYCLMRGYRPARFMVVGYSFLFVGIILKLTQYFDFWLPLGGLTHYSLGFGFIMEMMFLSFANSDKIRVMRIEKETAQEKIIEQLHINQELKDSYNQQLKEQVKIKTSELVEKTKFIEQQNRQLAEANGQLALQAEEIVAMNALLSQDNIQLKHDVEAVTEARILSRDVDFEEFSLMYPDNNSCLKFLADVKWQNGYACPKCGHANFSQGRSPYSRRCTKCGYDESVTAYTLLQNTRLRINKAFYMIFLVYASKGNISSHKLSAILNIRQSTCWSYSSKIKKAMREKQKNGVLPHEGWDSILLIHEAVSRTV